MCNINRFLFIFGMDNIPIDFCCDFSVKCGAITSSTIQIILSSTICILAANLVDSHKIALWPAIDAFLCVVQAILVIISICTKSPRIAKWMYYIGAARFYLIYLAVIVMCIILRIQNQIIFDSVSAEATFGMFLSAWLILIFIINIYYLWTLYVYVKHSQEHRINVIEGKGRILIISTEWKPNLEMSELRIPHPGVKMNV